MFYIEKKARGLKEEKRVYLELITVRKKEYEEAAFQVSHLRQKKIRLGEGFYINEKGDTVVAAKDELEEMQRSTEAELTYAEAQLKEKGAFIDNLETEHMKCLGQENVLLGRIRKVMDGESPGPSTTEFRMEQDEEVIGDFSLLSWKCNII